MKFEHDDEKFSLNLRTTIGIQLIQASFYDAEKFTSMLGLPFMSWKSYKKIGNYIGEEVIKIVSMGVQDNALQEEITFNYWTIWYQKIWRLTCISSLYRHGMTEAFIWKKVWFSFRSPPRDRFQNREDNL